MLNWIDSISERCGGSIPFNSAHSLCQISALQQEIYYRDLKRCYQEKPINVKNIDYHGTVSKIKVEVEIVFAHDAKSV